MGTTIRFGPASGGRGGSPPDAEWQLIKPLIPPAKRGGGKRTVNMREVVNGVMYVLSTGCQWRYIPNDLPPRSTVNGYFCFVRLGRHVGKDPSRTLCEMPRTGRTRGEPNGLRDRQPKREKRRREGSSIDPHGFDAGKLIKGKKRHVLVDTLGLVLHVLVTAANVQDRDGGVLLLSTLCGQFPFLRNLFADSAYAGPVFHQGATTAIRSLMIEIVKRADHAKGFVVEPKRWIVERSIG